MKLESFHIVGSYRIFIYFSLFIDWTKRFKLNDLNRMIRP